MSQFEKYVQFSWSWRMICTVILLTFGLQHADAAHIIGGEVTYENQGGGFYVITMKIYRDCFGSGANFDSAPGAGLDGTVTIYRGQQQFERVVLNRPEITRIENIDNPCLEIPPNVCVEEGVYRFRVLLPLSTETYTVVYQRCCRNQSITNLSNPGSTGATFFVQIFPEAQQNDYSSPEFDEFPPTVVCLNEELRVDHSATSSQPGSQLVYSLCPPSDGGGLAGADNTVPGVATDPNGVAPDPDLPPPYANVRYVLPLFSFDRPMGAAANMQINSNTGLLTGVPMAEGQYVVGVCVQEYVNGVLVAEIRRDFQFNVGVCDRKVFADVNETTILPDGSFFIRSCGDNTVTFDNQSTDPNFIESYHWYVDTEGSNVEFTDRDIAYTFPDTGVYKVGLYLNRDNEFEVCRDTAFIEVGVFGNIESDFSFEYDTCVANPVDFTQLATTENSYIRNYAWAFDDGNVSDEPNPSHPYMIAGLFDVALTVTDNRGCEATITKPLSYYPVPALVVAAPSRFVACTPAKISFDNLSTPVNEEYIINWDFGDGQQAEGLQVMHTYDNPGVYTVDIEIISPIGCQTSTTFRNWITVKQSPEAAFSYTPETFNDLSRQAFFTNMSQGADGYQWNFDDGRIEVIENPIHTFPDTGMFDVQLIAFSTNGCTDTATALIDVAPVSTYYLPNAFTPNSDEMNDTYKGTGVIRGIRAFSMKIWNRWGEEVFESSDPAIGWNGRRNNTGKLSPKGVYHCRVDYVTARGERKSVESSVTLIR